MAGLVVEKEQAAMKVLVLGAGFSGMGAAQRLREHGVDVSILEGSHRVGGRAHTIDVRPSQLPWACTCRTPSCASSYLHCAAH